MRIAKIGKFSLSCYGDWKGMGQGWRLRVYRNVSIPGFTLFTPYGALAFDIGELDRN